MHDDLAHRRQVLVRSRGEIIPNIALQRIGGEGAARVGLKQGYRDTAVRGEIIIRKEIIGQDQRHHLFLEVIGLGPLPILIPVALVDTIRGRGNFARMTARAVSREGDFPSVERRRVRRQVRRAARRILEQIGPRRFKKE